MSLNINQEKAIKAIDGPVLIIAGPGTGKTFTLVQRVIHMVVDRNIAPENILVSTFTNKAARELLDRLSLKFKELSIEKDVNDMFLGNFHSICRKILDKYIDFLDFKKGFKTIDDVEKKYLIYRNLEYFKKTKGYFDLIKDRDVDKIDRITKAIFEEGILEENAADPQIQVMLEIGKKYQELLISKNIMDFSAQLFYTYKLLMDYDQVRQELQNQISYLMIDEYQDTNTIQEKIMFAILNDDENICVVGDDDQGLYRFRGATVKNILYFPQKLTKPVEKIMLDINYRSQKDIVDFYGNFISGLDAFEDIDKYRFRKNLKAFRDDNTKSVFKIEAKDEEDFRESIVSCLKKVKEAGKIKSYNQAAILVSSVNDPRIMKIAIDIRKEGIGIYTPKTSKLISRPETRLIFGSLYSVFRPYMDSKKIKLTLDSYNFLGQVHTEFYTYEQKFTDLDRFLKAMSDFLHDEKLYISLLDILYRIFAYEPFFSFLNENKKLKVQKNISRILELIMSFCQMEGFYYITPRNIEKFCYLFFDAFIGFVKGQNVSEFEEETVIPDENQVSLLTIHASKGMEYPFVIMASLWDKPFKKRYINEFDKKIEDFLTCFGKKTFEPTSYLESLDFYRKYYTGFSRAENLLILASINGPNWENRLGPEIKRVFTGLRPMNALDLEKIYDAPSKERDSKEIYSYTQDIAQYRACPRAYKFFRKLKYPKNLSLGMTYGSLVHETIEFINNKLIKEEEVDLEKAYNHMLDLARNKYRSGATFINKNILERAKKEVGKYMEDREHFSNIISSELEISLAKDKYILTGNVDIVFEKDGKIGLVDFKTGKNSLENGNLSQFETYKGQLFFYKKLFELTKNREVSSLSLYYTSLSNEVSLVNLDMDEKELEESLVKVKETVEKIEDDVEFNKTQDMSKCKYCDLRFFCKRA